MASFLGVGLVASRGGRSVFEGVGFSLKPGDALLLVGPNGSGKSTLLRLLAGFGRPKKGVISWDGSDIHADIEAFRSVVHVVGHADAVKPALTVGELLGFWMALAGVTPMREKIDAALRSVGLDHLPETPCRFLSAGQRRRLALSRLAAVERRIWLLDEPSVGLDTEAVAQLAQMIERHRSAGGIAVLSTHQDLGIGGAASLSLADFPATTTADAAWWST